MGQIIFKTNTLKFKHKYKNKVSLQQVMSAKQYFSVLSIFSRMQQTNVGGRVIQKTLQQSSMHLFCIIKERIIICSGIVITRKKEWQNIKIARDRGCHSIIHLRPMGSSFPCFVVDVWSLQLFLCNFASLQHFQIFFCIPLLGIRSLRAIIIPSIMWEFQNEDRIIEYKSGWLISLYSIHLSHCAFRGLHHISHTNHIKGAFSARCYYYIAYDFENIKGGYQSELQSFSGKVD